MEQKTQIQTYDIGQEITLSSISSDLHWTEDSQISDYEFKYWTISRNDSEPFYQDKSEVILSGTYTHLYAQWEKVWFKINYDKNEE